MVSRGLLAAENKTDDIPALFKDEILFSQVTPAESGLPMPPTELKLIHSSALGQFKPTNHGSKPQAKKHKPQQGWRETEDCWSRPD